MAFCSNCGNQLEGNERFCVKCGKDLSAKSATTATAPVAAPPPPAATALPVMPPVPGAYVAPGAIPVAVAVSPAPAKRGGMFGTVIVVLALLGGGWYYYKHKPTPVTDPEGANTALSKQQAFDAHWQTVNGWIQISNAKWTNNAQTPIQSAILECAQYDASGNDLDEMRTTLNGPVTPGNSASFNPFWMGEVASNLNKVTCTIVHVKEPTPAQ